MGLKICRAKCVCSVELYASSHQIGDVGASKRNAASMAEALHFLQRSRHTIDYGLKDKTPALVGFADDFRGP